MSTLSLIGEILAVIFAIGICAVIIYLFCSPNARKYINFTNSPPRDNLSEVVIGSRKKDDDLGRLKLEEDIEALRRERERLDEQRFGIISSMQNPPSTSAFDLPPPPPTSTQPNGTEGLNSDCYYQAGRLGPFSSSSGGANNDRLAPIRAKLDEETAKKKKEQQDYYDKIKEGMNRKHEEEMGERESRFRIVVEEKMKADKEEFLQWTTIPD